jgi:hypothetical protein
MTSDATPSAVALKAEWSIIMERLESANGRGVLEKALFSRDSVGISAIVRIEDQLPGIAIRSPFRWTARGWQVQRYAGIQFEQPIEAQGATILPLFLIDQDAVEVFSHLASDLVEVASAWESSEIAARRLLERVALWLRFFRRFSAPLTREEIRGLLGELKCLHLLVDALGPDAALEAWKGPEGGIHDFATDICRVEVKTWGSDSSPRVMISDPGQVVIDDAWPVFLCGIQVLDDELNGKTLPEELASFKGRLPDGLRSAFEALAADVGYLDAHAHHYVRRYSISDCVFYRMSSGFPCIDPATLVPGVVGVRYAVEVKSLSPFLSPSPFAGFRP